jgi:septal ring factor EnvC (AmiA/AmiB activator)
MRVCFSDAHLRCARFIRFAIFWLLSTIGLSQAQAGSSSSFTTTLRQEASTLVTLESLTDWVIRAEQDLEEAQYRLNQLDYQINEANRRIKAFEERLAAQRKYLQQRIRSLYKLSRGGVVRLVLEAGEKQNLSTQLSVASLILRRDLKELDTYQREKKQLLKEKQQLETRRLQHTTLVNHLARKQKELQESRSKQVRLLRQVQANRKQQLQMLEEISQEQQALLTRIHNLGQRLWTAGGFAARRRRLPRPVAGPIAWGFGQVPDPEGKLLIARHGMTFKPPLMAEVRAVAPGVVRLTKPVKGFGRLIVVEHSDGYFSVYGFLSQFSMWEGARVNKETVLGKAGRDPLTGQPALYFELRHNERPLDPAEWLRK